MKTSTDKCSWLVSGDEYYISSRMIWYGSDFHRVSFYLDCQAIERYLKSLLLNRGAGLPPVKGEQLHDLVILSEYCEPKIKSIFTYKEFIET